MRIAMFTDSFWPRVNGVTVSIETFAQALIRRGHEVLIVCPDYPDQQAVERMYYKMSDIEHVANAPIIQRVPSYRLPISKEDRLAKIHKCFWLARKLKAFYPDLVHIHTEFVMGEFGILYARQHHLRVVYTQHTYWEDYIGNYIPLLPVFLLKYLARSILRKVASRVDGVIAPSEQIRQILLKYKIKKKIWLLPTGIDPEFFRHEKKELNHFRKDFESRFPEIRKKRILLFAGRIGKEKNILLLLQALQKIFAEEPDTILLAAGNGPDLPFFLKEAEKLGIRDRCIFTGYLDRSDLSCVYALAEVFVFPSRTETQGLVTIEAMLSGTPVVAVGEMGTLMVMGGDNGGFMVKNDPEEFAGRVLQLLQDRDLYAAKVEEALQHGKSWSIDTMAGRLEAIYTSLLEPDSKTVNQEDKRLSAKAK